MPLDTILKGPFHHCDVAADTKPEFELSLVAENVHALVQSAFLAERRGTKSKVIKLQGICGSAVLLRVFDLTQRGHQELGASFGPVPRAVECSSSSYTRTQNKMDLASRSAIQKERFAASGNRLLVSRSRCCHPHTRTHTTHTHAHHAPLLPDAGAAATVRVPRPQLLRPRQDRLRHGLCDRDGVGGDIRGLQRAQVHIHTHTHTLSLSLSLSLQTTRL